MPIRAAAANKNLKKETIINTQIPVKNLTLKLCSTPHTYPHILNRYYPFHGSKASTRFEPTATKTAPEPTSKSTKSTPSTGKI